MRFYLLIIYDESVISFVFIINGVVFLMLFICSNEFTLLDNNEVRQDICWFCCCCCLSVLAIGCWEDILYLFGDKYLLDCWLSICTVSFENDDDDGNNGNTFNVIWLSKINIYINNI